MRKFGFFLCCLTTLSNLIALFQLQQCSSTESITETKVKEIQEKLSYKEINLSTEIVKHLKEGLNDGTEYSGSEFNVVFSESQMDIKHNEESKNVAIGLQECLERPKSPLQVSCFDIKWFGIHYKCS